MLFAFDKNQSDTLPGKVFSFMRLAREKVFCKPNSAASTFLDIAILSYVRQKENPAMKDIATTLRVSPPAATSVIDKLIERGFLKRSEDSQDRRVVRLSVTQKGLGELGKGTEQALQGLDELFDVLDERERSEFGRLITKILDYHA